jgi:mannose-1-phosphate guanylyltransferase/mannose-6-phosphate isomerase
MLSAALLKDISNEQPLMYLSSDHLIEKMSVVYKEIKKNQSNLNDKNLFIFGIKPTSPLPEYGYFLTKKIKGINRVIKFIEKPIEAKAKKIIKQNGYWNSAMFFVRKDSLINNFKKYQPTIYRNCVTAVNKAKYKSNTYFLNKASFIKATAKSFDYAILEKTKKINAIKLNIPWSDLGSWKEILMMYSKNKNKYVKKKNIYYRPWGRYTNLFEGKEFLFKELFIKPKGILSLQKHLHRGEHWLVTKGNPKITLNREEFFKKPNDHIFIPVKAIHRIENLKNKPIKIIEAQIGAVLKEDDIIRYEDIYGRVK